MSENTMRIKRFTAIIIAFAILLMTASCSSGKSGKAASGEATKLSFKSAMSYDYLKTIDGKPVTINGYLATSSPTDGSFIFLMNLPYQSCPFCKPNTSQLSNTLEVYPKKNEKFDYTTQAVKVTGVLEVAPSEDKAFTDMYGYEFNFKIVDAEYKILKAEELGEEYAMWSKIAESDIVNELYAMYDYVCFVCSWNTYSVKPWTDEEGKHNGYYLNDADAKHFLEADGAQYHYGYKEGYFDDIIAKIKAIDPDVMADLIKNVESSKALAEKALKELYDGNFTKKMVYIEDFECEDYRYTLNKGDELIKEFESLYDEFANWLGSWEM